MFGCQSPIYLSEITIEYWNIGIFYNENTKNTILFVYGSDKRILTGIY